MAEKELTHVLGLDPGKTTGVAFFDIKRDKVLWVKAIIDDPLEIAELVTKTVDEFPGTYVIIEDFVGCGRRSASIIYTLKLVGWLQYYCKFNGYNGAMQQPQRRKSRVPTAKQLLKKAKMRNITHTRDALAHCLAYKDTIL